MIVTMQGKRVMVTAYPGSGAVRVQVSLMDGESAAGDAQMLLGMARELCTAALCTERLGELMRAEREEDADGVLLRA